MPSRAMRSSGASSDLRIFAQGIHAGYAVYFPELFPTHLRATGAGFCFNTGRILAAPVLIWLSAWMKQTYPLPNAIMTLGGFFLLGLIICASSPRRRIKPYLIRIFPVFLSLSNVRMRYCRQRKKGWVSHGNTRAFRPIGRNAIACGSQSITARYRVAADIDKNKRGPKLHVSRSCHRLISP